MTFGEKINYSRKQKKMTQGDLGKAVGTSGDFIGKYKRKEIKPSSRLPAGSLMPPA
jgi:transcriptional regulator with XRE-family HTH domain